MNEYRVINNAIVLVLLNVANSHPDDPLRVQGSLTSTLAQKNRFATNWGQLHTTHRWLLVSVLVGGVIDLVPAFRTRQD